MKTCRPSRRLGKHLNRVTSYTLDRLEPRLLLTTVNWVGGPTGNWNVPANWDSNALPGAVDDVVISGGVMVNVDSDVPTVNSMMSTFGNALIISGGSLSISNGGMFIGGELRLEGGVFTASTVDSSHTTFGGSAFRMSGGTLKGNIHFTTGGQLNWSGGEMASPGVTRAVGANSTVSFIETENTVVLSRLLDWSGRGLQISGNVEMRTGSSLNIQASFGYLLSLRDAVITDGGGAGVFRCSRPFFLHGESTISVRSEVTGDEISMQGGATPGTLSLLGGGNGTFVVENGSEVRIGGEGFALVGLGSKELDGEIFFDEGDSTFAGVADAVTVVGTDTRLTITAASTFNQLTIDGSAQMRIESAVIQVDGPFLISGSGSLTLAAHAPSVAPALLKVNGPLVMSGSASLTLATHAPAPDPHVLRTQSVAQGGASVINVNDNAVVVDYTGGLTPPLDLIQALINSGRAGGTWTGSGITSIAAKNNPLHNTTLGAMDSADFKMLYGPAALFQGQEIITPAVLVRYTYYGDTDFNGIIDFDDYSRADAGFNTHRSGWLNGDFDGNGVLDFDDFSLIDLAFNTQDVQLRPSAGRVHSKLARFR
jgi:hypothetical protein